MNGKRLFCSEQCLKPRARTFKQMCEVNAKRTASDGSWCTSSRVGTLDGDGEYEVTRIGARLDRDECGCDRGVRSEREGGNARCPRMAVWD